MVIKKAGFTCLFFFTSAECTYILRIMKKPTRHKGSCEDALKKLRKEYQGFRKIGEGCYSDVYAPYAQDIVFKVTKTDGNINSDGWYKWYKLMQKSGDSKARRRFPKVKFIRLYDDGYIACIERLYRINHSKFGRKKEQKCDFIIQAIDAIMQLSKKDFDHVVALREILKGHPNMHDLHNENIMVRKNGEWVLTDPLA